MLIVPWADYGMPTITVTGEKNARLICITDDNSIIEPEAETEATIEKICQTDDVEPTKILIRPSSQTQTDFSSPCPKVSKVTQKGKQNTYCKSNPMYKKSTSCQPWLLMNKISEEILNHCLLAVAGEIEVNDIVDRVYQAELQL
ncbi:hypothetical protein GWI33_017350 [Rhynchophorus ferrugineus]|uniref:Uncharacterized protein n=1 Tax=Rhynchophorus ferrugineus TaxID=354439 RepID=A0A834HYB9_RHYFE|nr:hypothetical protein GWI33_017350 [Rhynchophorus ferrugineus]